MDSAATDQAAMGSLVWSTRTGQGIRGRVALEQFACRHLTEAAGSQHRERGRAEVPLVLAPVDVGLLSKQAQSAR